MTDVAAACAELATLWAALPGALERDTGDTSPGRSWIPAGVVNTDVLHALETLRREIPRAHQMACASIQEPWAPRPIPTILIALPRLTQRLADTNQPHATKMLTLAALRWLRTTKVALGLRYPDEELRTDDNPDGWRCPYSPMELDIHEHIHPILIKAGSEGFLQPNGQGWTVAWVRTSQIYCPLCGRTWAPPEWVRLVRILQLEQALWARAARRHRRHRHGLRRRPIHHPHLGPPRLAHPIRHPTKAPVRPRPGDAARRTAPPT
jgi:hypothetical protein